MTSRQLKLLTASTAFIAVAGMSAAHAEVINSVSNTPRSTATTTGGIMVTGTGGINAVGVPAIQLDSAVAADNTISVTTGGFIRSGGAGQTSATIMSVNTSNAGVTINNSGTIAAIGGTAAAMDFTGDVNGATIRNAGTISGSITFGNGANVLNSSNITSGTINGGSSTDDLTFTSGANHTGNITLGGGVNSVSASGAIIRGNITGGAVSDTITIQNNSTVTGNIDLGTTAGGNTHDTLTVSNSRINGNILSGASSTANITLTNAVVSGTIIDSDTNDNDTLTINGQNTFTTMGAVSGYENVNLQTNAVFNDSVGGINTLTVNPNKTLTANKMFGTNSVVNNGTININDDTAAITGLLTNAGTVNIAAGKTLQAGTISASAGVFGIGVANATSAGQLALTGGNVSTTSVKINMGANTGYIANGTSYIIATGTGTAVTSTLLTSDTALYGYSLSTNGGDVVLNVSRASNTAIVTGGDNKAAGAAIEKLGTLNNAEIIKVQSAIGQQTTAKGVEDVIESLTPSIDGVGAASIGVTVDTGNQISNRLASVRSSSGVATGDPMASKHMWLQGFGSTVSQDDRGGNSGYDANSGGVSIGVDTDTLFEGVTTGVAFSYGRSTVDSNASSNASADIDTYIGTIYGSRVFDNGVFFNGQIGGGYNKYDMERTIIGVGKSKGDTDGFQGTAKVEAGRDFAVNNFTVTPLASLQYTYLDMDSYTESGAGGASLRVDPEALSTWDAGVGGQVAYAVPLSDGGTLKPSAHAKYIYRMGDDSMGTTSSFTGGGAAFNTVGVKADRSSVNLGAGLVLTTIGGTDLSLNYDADIRSNLTGHTGQVKARWAF